MATYSMVLKTFKSCLCVRVRECLTICFNLAGAPDTIWNSRDYRDEFRKSSLAVPLLVLTNHALPHTPLFRPLLLQSPESMPPTRWPCPRHPRLMGCHPPLYHLSSCSATWPRPTTPTDRVSGWGTERKSITPGGKRSTRNTSELWPMPVGLSVCLSVRDGSLTAAKRGQSSDSQALLKATGSYLQ